MSATPTRLLTDAEVRERITALRKIRDSHNIDEPDYVDGIATLIHEQVRAAQAKELKRARMLGYIAHHKVPFVIRRIDRLTKQEPTNE